jgi:MarR family transcriptional regulator, organic hydroperoxide resistance regulator
MHLSYLLELGDFFSRLLRTAGGLSMTNIFRYYILKTLLKKNHLNLTEIADHLNLKKNSLSQMLDRMVNDGLIERTPHTVDRRKIILSITPKGRDVITEFGNVFFSNLKNNPFFMPEDEQKEFMKSVGNLIRILRTNQDEIDSYFAKFSVKPEEI